MVPQRVDGDEMEPSVSDPMAKATHPAAVAEAEPADDPLEPWRGFQGLRVMPPNHLSPCAPRRAIALHGQKIFCAPRQSVQRSAIFSGGNLAVGFLRFGLRAVLRQRDDKFQRRIVALEARQIHVRQRDRRNFLGAYQFGKLAHGAEGNVFNILGRSAGVNTWRGGNLDRPALSLKFHPRQHRIKDECRRNFIADIQFVNCVVALCVFRERLEHHVLVFVANVDAGNRGGVVNHVARDFAFFVGHGPQNAGQQSGSKTKTRTDSKKIPAIQHDVSPEIFELAGHYKRQHSFAEDAMETNVSYNIGAFTYGC